MQAREDRSEEVLDYWLGQPSGTEEELSAKVRRWFGGGSDIDQEVTERFGELVEQALNGELQEWEGVPRKRLALILLLDQFTRNMYRDTPRMYQGDARARALALDAVNRGLHRDLSVEERSFLYLPLLHAEDMALQLRMGTIVRETQKTTPPLFSKMVEAQREQSDKYLSIIQRFGRFPHRNRVLGRDSSPEEVEFLVHWEKLRAPSAVKSEPLG